MKFLKEKKGIIISFIIGVIIASSITVYATSYLASQVIYKDGKTVEQALNDLYSKSKNSLIKIADLNDNNTFEYDCKKINNYDELTEANFIIVFDSIYANSAYLDDSTQSYSKIYNKETGILKLTRTAGWYVNGSIYYCEI